MERVLDLTLKLADEGLTADEQAELERLIEAEPMARRKHLQMLEVEAALRAAPHQRAGDTLAVTPSTSLDLERRVTAVVQRVRRSPLPRSRRLRIAGVAGLVGALAAAAVALYWRPRPAPVGGRSGPMARMSSTRPVASQLVPGGGAWRTAVLPVQAAAPADHVALELGEHALLEVRGRAVVGVERAAGDDENRVMLEEGTLAYHRHGGAAEPPTTFVTPHGTIALRGGRAVIAASAEGTRLHLAEGEAIAAPRNGDPTPVGPRKTATLSRQQVTTAPLPSVLFVSGPQASRLPPEYIDDLISRRLETIGFRVDAVDELDLRAEKLAGHALLFISPTVSATMRDRIQELSLAAASIPILCSRPMLYAELGMTAPGKASAEYSERKRHAVIVEEGHPLAAGLAGNVELLGATMSLGWGIPGPGAVRIAGLRERPDRATIFAYERDAALLAPVTRAPARRVGFFLHSSDARFLQDRAWRLFDAAVKWTAADPQ